MVQLGLLYDPAWLQPPFSARALVPLLLPAAARGPGLTPPAGSPTAGWGAPLARCCKAIAGLSSVVSSRRWQGRRWEARSPLRNESH